MRFIVFGPKISEITLKKNEKLTKKINRSMCFGSSRVSDSIIKKAGNSIVKFSIKKAKVILSAIFFCFIQKALIL